MSNQEIFVKAIKKAVSNGWNENHWANIIKDSMGAELTAHYNTPESIIYSHPFAKALWGEEWKEASKLQPAFEHTPRWHHFLQEMVIAEDPIKYLGDNI